MTKDKDIKGLTLPVSQILAPATQQGGGEVFVEVAGLLGLAGEYAVWSAMPLLDTKSNSWMAVVSKRVRNDNGAPGWKNEYEHWACRWDIGCTQLLYKKQISHGYEIAGGSITPWYAPDGTLWGFFGCASRRSNTDAAFVVGLLNFKFQD